MIFRPVKTLALVVGGVCFSLSLWAQQLTDTVHIDEIIVTGDRIFKKEEAGIKRTQIDSMILIDKINVSLSEVLSQNTTVFIKEYGRGALATASFRGTAPSHTQVYWNGLTINSPMLGMTDFSLIPSFIVDDMKLEHGVASLSSGSGGLGGSIILQNTPDWDNRFSWRYFQGIGSYATYDEFLQLGLGSRKFQSKTRIYFNNSENDYHYINKAILERPLVKNSNAAFLKKGIMQECYVRTGENAFLSLKAWAQISDRSLPAVMSYEGDIQSNLNNQTDSTLKIVADFNCYIGSLKLTARSGFDLQRTNYQLNNYINGIGMIPAMNSSSSAINWHNHIDLTNSFSNQLSWNGSFDFKHYSVNSYESIKKTGYIKSRNDLSAFAGLYYNVNQKLNFSLMLRDDYINGMLSPIMTNIGVSFNPLDKKKLILKANLSRNIHQPTLNDLYWQPGGNPNLVPEESYSFEFSIEHILNKTNITIEQVLTPYFSDINNWIIWLPSFQGHWQPFNLKKVKSFGLEYNIKYIQNIGNLTIQAHGNYALTKSINLGDKRFLGDGSYGKQLPFLPVHSGNILVSASWKGYYIRFQNNSYGERFTLSSNDIGLNDDSQEIGAGVSTMLMNWYYPYFMNNLSLGKDIQLKKYILGIDFKIYNLFNEQYRSALGRFMPGRNYELLIKISYRK